MQHECLPVGNESFLKLNDQGELSVSFASPQIMENLLVAGSVDHSPL